MGSMAPRPYRMINQIQHYAWGTTGEDAFIPTLLGIQAEADVPYAELWMGTHPNAPSDVVVDGARVSLTDLIARHPTETLGAAVANRFSGRLPFLFKVLSAAQALSIQAHPNKEQAEHLHAADPEHYPDANHKPEMAVALDSLTALVGFRRLPEILDAFDRYPELADLVGQDPVQAMRQARGAPDSEKRDALRAMYSTLMHRSIEGKEAIAEAIIRLGSRLKERRGRSPEEEVFLELRGRYPDDVGVFSAFLLNLVYLQERQAIFLGPGLPHAYLNGNIVECMARSDNVVRAGLTPKYTDVETLVQILTYEMAPPPIVSGDPTASAIVYHSPAPEFEVTRRELQPGQLGSQASNDSPHILLVVAGEVVLAWGTGSGREEKAFHRGQSAFLPACLETVDLRAEQPTELFLVDVPKA